MAHLSRQLFRRVAISRMQIQAECVTLPQGGISLWLRERHRREGTAGEGRAEEGVPGRAKE